MLHLIVKLQITKGLEMKKITLFILMIAAGLMVACSSQGTTKDKGAEAATKAAPQQTEAVKEAAKNKPTP
jgi:hypothetical protein